MIDINSLDEEVKMSVVKFKKEKQKKVKVLSKIIAVIAKIGWICSIVGIVAISIVALVMPFALKNITIEDNKIITNSNVVEIAEEDNKLVLKHNNIVIADVTDQERIDVIKDTLNSNLNNKALLIGYSETALITLIVCLVLLIFMFKRLEELFNNINKGDTPFTLENVEHIKKIAYLMIALIILPNICGMIFELILKKDLDVTFEFFNVIEILIIFVIAYIFEYGYEIQLDSKGKMYGEENE